MIVTLRGSEQGVPSRVTGRTPAPQPSSWAQGAIWNWTLVSGILTQDHSNLNTRTVMQKKMVSLLLQLQECRQALGLATDHWPLARPGCSVGLQLSFTSNKNRRTETRKDVRK